MLIDDGVFIELAKHSAELSIHSLGLEDGVLAASEVSIYAGDSNCPCSHRYLPETGHGWTHVLSESDGPIAEQIEDAMRQFREEIAKPIKPESCKCGCLEKLFIGGG